jgi:nucleotidyltransferase substrate binding protein (TIGR01987 family)
MEKLKDKYKDLVRIHCALAVSIERYRKSFIDETVDHETQEERRDSLIKRFELTYDLLWKYLREYINEMQGNAADAPRKVFQQCLSLGLTNAEETQQLVDLIEDRNLTTHVYNINLANDVAGDIPEHYDVIHGVIIKLSPDSIKR